MRQQPFPQGLRKIVLKFFDDPLLAEYREQVTALLREETVGQLRRRLEVPLEVGQLVALDLTRPGGVDAVRRDEVFDGSDGLVVAKFINRDGCFLFRELDRQDTTLLLEDRLERLDVGVEVDRQRVGDADRERHHPVEAGTLFEDHNRAGSLRLESLKKGVQVGEVLWDAQALGGRERFDVRFAGFELPVTEAIEDGEEQRVIADQPLAREVEVEGDYRTLVVIAGYVAELVATDERSLGKGCLEVVAAGDLFGGTDHGARRPRAPNAPLSLFVRFPRSGHPFVPIPLTHWGDAG